MQVSAISPLCYTRQKNKKNIAFGGINEEAIDKFLVDDGKKVENIIGFFGDEYKKIRQKWQEKISMVSGWFSRFEKDDLSEKEALELKRLMADQRVVIAALRKMNEKAAMCADAIRAAGESEKEKIMLSKRLAEVQKNQQRIMTSMEELWKTKNETKGFDSMGGYLQEKCILNEVFIKKLPLEIAGEDVDIPNAILFFGPTGCGKTSFAKALAGESKCLLNKVGTRPASTTREFILNFWDELQEKAMDAEKNFKKFGVRTILLVDDLDVVFGKDSPIIPDLNDFMQSCSKDFHTTLFITTNEPLNIPSPTRNNRRMPIKVSLDAPDKIDVGEILRLYLGKKKSNVDYESVSAILAQRVNGEAYACSQIEDICKKVIMQGKDTITDEDILAQAKKVRRGISKKQLEKFKNETEQLNVIGVRK